MDGISVVICCYNSAHRLPETLDHLLAQRLPGSLSWEVIVVDNASADDTDSVAQEYISKFKGICGYRIIKEPEPGLSYARQAGINTAVYSYVLFCDDDNWLSENYLAESFALMQADHTIGACGGKGIAKCETSAPEWFNDFERPYAVGSPNTKQGVLENQHQFLTGAGMMIRVSAWQQLEQAGFRSLLKDRTGKSLSSGGDLEICSALRLAGYRLYYIDNIHYIHYIPKERLTPRYLTKLIDGIARANVVLAAYQYVQNQMNTEKKFLWLRNLVLLTPDLLRQMFTGKNSVVKKMELLAARSYYTELLKLNGQFDRNIATVSKLKENLAGK